MEQEKTMTQPESTENNAPQIAQTATETADAGAPVSAAVDASADASANTSADADSSAESSNPAPKAKTIVKGVISKIAHQVAFVILESGHEARINVAELAELRDESGEVPLGSEVTAEVTSTRSGIELSRDYIARERSLDEIEAAFNTQGVIQGRIKGVNKGGFDVRIGEIDAFCPRSRFSKHRAGNPKQQINKVMDFMVEELQRRGRPRVVVTRLPILEKQAQERSRLIGERFTVGEKIQGRVTQLVKFGAFVDVGEGIEGLIPMSELSHDRVESAASVLSANQEIEVQVIGVDAERGRLSLSIRALTPDAWDSFVEEHQAGAQVSGTVTRLTDFGAFVELAPRIEGLIHISAISAGERLNHPSEKLSEGQSVDVIIEEIVPHARPDKRRIRLMTQEVAERRAPLSVSVSVGELITAPVKSANERGVTLEIAKGLEGFIPASETDTARGVNLAERFKEGAEVEAKVITADLRRRRVKLSIKAIANHEEEMAYKAFRSEMRADASRMRSTFGDLLKQLD